MLSVFDKKPQNNGPPHEIKLVEQPAKKEDQSEKLQTVSDGAEKTLLKASAIFPFDLFPNEVVIDKYKVCIITHEFFLSKDVHSVMIDLIKDVEAETSVFFGTLKIVPDGYPAQPICIGYLKKEDALKAQRIIQGLMVAKKAGVKVEELNDDTLCSAAEKVGGV